MNKAQLLKVLTLAFVSIFFSSNDGYATNQNTKSIDILSYITNKYGSEQELIFDDFLRERLAKLGTELPENSLGIIAGSTENSNEDKLRFVEQISLLSVSESIDKFGLFHLSTLNSLDGAGFNYLQQVKNFHAAEIFLASALVVSAKLQGADHPQTLSLSQFLGNAYEAQNSFSDAKVFYEHAAAGRKRVFGDSHAKYLESKQALDLLQEKHPSPTQE